MKYLITIGILVLVFLGARSLLNEWKSVQSQSGNPAAVAQPVPASEPAAQNTLTGLPPELESSLNAAIRQGPDALKVWIKHHREKVRDPRLADIELDYVVMVGGKDFGEACDVLAAVRQRTPKDSPLMPKIKSLEKTYRRPGAD